MISPKIFKFSCRRLFSTSSKSIIISDKVRHALQNNEPVVALESTIITHGMPHPHNIQCAKRVEEIIEQNVSIFYYLDASTVLHAVPRVRSIRSELPCLEPVMSWDFQHEFQEP